jgi:hypothetical protein
MTGYDLYTEAARMIATIESVEGADPEQLDPQLAAWLTSCDDKIGAYHAVLKRLELEDVALKAEADAIAAARRRMAKQSERVRDLATILLLAMEQLGEEPKVKRATFSAWLLSTESVTAPEDAALLPLAYQRVKIEANKSKLKDALKAGELVDGCGLLTTRSVVIRSSK